MFVLNKYSYIGLYLFFTFFILSDTNTPLKSKHGGNITWSATKLHGKKQAGSGVRVHNFVTDDKAKKNSRIEKPQKKKMLRRYLTTMHSNIITKDFGKFRVQVLPALSDNFMYLLIDKSTKEAAIVDPVAPDVVWDAVRRENVKLTTVLTTHHHWDHAGGNKELISGNTNGKLTVIGGDERIDGLTVMIDKHGVDLQLGTLNIKCLRTPCHTTGHVCYYVNSGQDGVVFTGDTLFLGGCGRFFEGNATQMYDALIKTLSRLPDSTAVFCGHEYAIQNLKFGLHVEPSNQDILSKLADIETKRETMEPSVPSTIGLEKLINPFMRVEKELVQKVTKSVGDPIETMRILREMKNNL